MDGYYSLKESVQTEYIVKHSRFIGYAAPVTSRKAATDFIESVRAKHRDATHNVYAYILREDHHQKYSDDGEPQGTAGLPVFDVLRKNKLVDCGIVVTRYFGGILLGGGGLVRAYSHTAALAVEAAGICFNSLCVTAYCDCDYSFYSTLTALISASGGEIKSTDFTTSVRVEFVMPAELYGVFSAKLTEQSNGRLNAVVLNKAYCALSCRSAERQD